MEEIKSSVISRFLDRCASSIGAAANMVRVYTNPTEEIHEAAVGGKSIKMYAAGRNMLATQATGARARLEENYLYDTRRFASGTGAIIADNLFFANAIGLPAINNGFASGTMSEAETNMDVPAQIPQGKDYVLTQIGISFNAGIANGDAVQFLDNAFLRFSKQGGQFTLKHGPLGFWPGGMGVQNASVTINAANGVPDIRNCRKLAVPRVLRAKDQFNYSVSFPRSTTNLDMSTAITLAANCLVRVWLWGGQQDAIPV
jgi:hypothetical protein